MSDAGVTTHFVCAKGNDHWLSHVWDWESDQVYYDRCRVHIKVEGGHAVHLTVLPDVVPGDPVAAQWGIVK